MTSALLPEQVEIVTALHACNTATDDAIRFGLEKNAKFMVLVPCCQAEVAEVLRKHKNESFGKTPLSEIWRHPIHTREFGSQITNVLRCLQLEAHGYQVTVTELVGWEHSMKNELIIARYKNSPRKNAQVRLAQILETLVGRIGAYHDDRAGAVAERHDLERNALVGQILVGTSVDVGGEGEGITRLFDQGYTGLGFGACTQRVFDAFA